MNSRIGNQVYAIYFDVSKALNPNEPFTTSSLLKTLH